MRLFVRSNLNPGSQNILKASFKISNMRSLWLFLDLLFFFCPFDIMPYKSFDLTDTEPPCHRTIGNLSAKIIVR